MTALAVTPLADLAAVRLEVTGAPAGAVTITRVDVNGARTVRLLAGQAPIAGTLTVTDYEPALTGSIRYDVADALGAITSAMTSLAGVVAGRVLRRNLVPNPSFEVNTTGWTALNGGGVRSNASAKSGTWSSRFTCAAAGIPSYLFDGIVVEANKPYVASVWVYVPATLTQEFSVSVDWKDAGGTVITTDNSDVFHRFKIATAGYVRVIMDGIAAPSGAVTAAVGVRAWGVCTGADIFHVDAFQLEQASFVSTYFDGSTAPTPGTAEINAWTAAAHNSASTVSELVQIPAVTAPQLVVPVLPQLRADLRAVIDYGSTRDSAGTVHTVIGRPDPLVTIGKLGLRAGTLKVWAESHAAARGVEALCDSGELMLFRQVDHDGMDMYFTTTSTQIQPEGLVQDETQEAAWRWTVTLTYVETAAPTGPLLGSVGWTFGAHTALGVSFADSRSLFPTFTDRLIGPT